MNDRCEDLKEMQVIQMNDTTVIICLLTSDSKNLFCFKGNFLNNNNIDSDDDEDKNIFQLNQMCRNLIQCGEHFSIYKYSDDEVMIGCLINDTEKKNEKINMQILSINCITQNFSLGCRDIYVKDFIIYNEKQYYIGIKNDDENNIFFIYTSKTEKLYRKINDSKNLTNLENKNVLIRENNCSDDLYIENRTIKEINEKINLNQLLFNADYNKSCYFFYSNDESDLNKIELISCHKNCHSCITSVSENKMNCIRCENDDNYELIYYDGEEVGNCCQKETDCISYNEHCQCKLSELKDELYFIDKSSNKNININLIPNYSLKNQQNIFIETINGFKGTIISEEESEENSENSFFINKVNINYINNEGKGNFAFYFSLYENNTLISNVAKITIYVCDINNEYFDKTIQKCINENEREKVEEEEEEAEEKEKENEEKGEEEKEK